MKSNFGPGRDRHFWLKMKIQIKIPKCRDKTPYKCKNLPSGDRKPAGNDSLNIAKKTANSQRTRTNTNTPMSESLKRKFGNFRSKTTENKEEPKLATNKAIKNGQKWSKMRREKNFVNFDEKLPKIKVATKSPNPKFLSLQTGYSKISLKFSLKSSRQIKIQKLKSWIC